MKKKQPNYSSVLIAGGVIFAAGFLFGSLLNRDSNESVLDEVTKKILANSANQTDQQTLERAAIDGMLKSLGDKWSQYLPSTGNKSFEESIEGFSQQQSPRQYCVSFRPRVMSLCFSFHSFQNKSQSSGSTRGMFYGT